MPKSNSNQNNENIEKFSGSFENEQSGCSIFINETVNIISNMQVGGIYLYLMCRPKNWKLSPRHLATHFNCNKETVYKYLSILQEIGLLTRMEIREKGKFSKYHYKLHLHPQPVDNKEILPCTEKPYAVISDTYKTKIIKNKDYKNTTTTKDSDKNNQVSSSKPIINKKVDDELLFYRSVHLKGDKRSEEEFLKQCSHHLDNGDKNKYSFAARLKGLSRIIQKGFFEVPPGYKENKVIKSKYSPEQTALIASYNHFSNLPKAKIEDFMSQNEIKEARRLLKL